MRGRKPKYESRTKEIRHRLIAWKQTPESLRPSLRALEAETGVSHQLFSFYLKGLDKSLAKERAKQIRARAKAEGREMTMRECYDAIITPGMLDQIEKLRGEAKRGPLNRHQVQILKLLARQFPQALEILQKCRRMTPQEERQARAAEKATMFTAAALKNIERIKHEAELGPLPWRDIEILKILARRKCSGAKELLLEHAKSTLPRPQVPQ